MKKSNISFSGLSTNEKLDWLEDLLFSSLPVENSSFKGASDHLGPHPTLDPSSVKLVKLILDIIKMRQKSNSSEGYDFASLMQATKLSQLS